MWIMPSRERPHNVARFFAAYHNTLATTPGVVCIRDNDHTRSRYEAITMPPGWTLIAYPPMSMGDRTNRVFDDNPGKDWYGYLDDDSVPETPHWDVMLVAAAGRAGIAHCFNGIGNEKLASQFVMGGDLARDLGWVLLRGVARLYGDNAVTDVGRKRNCITYLPDVRVIQHHFSNGLAKMDATYAKPEAAADKAIYMDWCARC